MLNRLQRDAMAVTSRRLLTAADLGLVSLTAALCGALFQYSNVAISFGDVTLLGLLISKNVTGPRPV